MFLNIWGGGAALMFYVAIRRPTKNDLEIFKSKTPKLLQPIYFNSKNAYIYSRSSERPGIEDLLFQREPVWLGLIGLILYLVLVYGILFLLIVRDGGIHSNIGYIVSLLVPLRIIFFGFNLKRDPTFYFPE